MLDVLSQSEIDSLVNSMQFGQPGETTKQESGSARPYDFRTANRFTKEHIRTIEAVFKNFAYLLSNYFVGMLHTSCEIDVLALEEMSFNEVTNSMPYPSIISVINMIQMHGSAIFQISKETACSVISRVLGGSQSVSADNRQFTEIEMAIMERVIWQTLKYYDDAWSKMVTVTTNVERIETSMQFAQIVDANEAVLVVPLNIQLGGESGLITFCLPRKTLTSQLKKLSPKQWYAREGDKNIETHPDHMMRSLSNTFVELSATFHTTVARVEDVIRLQPGDVIKLDHMVDDPLVVSVQHTPKFFASYGKYRNNCAIKIEGIYKGDEQNG